MSHPPTSWDDRSGLTPPEFDGDRFSEEEALREAEEDRRLCERYDREMRGEHT